jgi:hypothetical protein
MFSSNGFVVALMEKLCHRPLSKSGRRPWVLVVYSELAAPNNGMWCSDASNKTNLSGGYRLSAPEEDQKKSVPARTRRAPEILALPRTANQVIDQAIEDNKFTEHLLNGFAVVFVASGIVTLIAGAIRGESLVAIAGAVATSLFYPAMRQARQIRRENIAIRLLEAPLSKAETSHEASVAVKEFFSDTFKANP